MTVAIESLLARLAEAERRLVEHADVPLPDGLTDPEPATEERWEAGQVWAHVAEFPGYWLSQAEAVLARPESQPVRFGRTKTDAARIEAIERDRHADPAALLRRVREALAHVRGVAHDLPDAAWTVRGTHPTLGEMTVESIIERFIVRHLEEHAEQLDQLRAARG